MKYLIVGLGNIGSEYVGTRHNIGFQIVDHLASSAKADFVTERYAQRCEIKIKGKPIILIKPTTFMNLSGKAVRYWMQQEQVPLENILVIVDDLALDFGKLRLKKNGSDGGHNGLIDIGACLDTTSFARLRFGIDKNFYRGQQSDYVLSPFSPIERETLDQRIELAAQMIQSFVCIGPEQTMTFFNNK